MNTGTCIILEVELGAVTPVRRAANQALPRIVPVPRRPLARTPVRWTLCEGTVAPGEVARPQSA